MRFNEFKLNPIVESLLYEVAMSPSALQQWATSPAAQGVKMGFEFEVIVPNAVGELEPEWEYDYDQDESCNGIEDILDFFQNGEFSDMTRNERRNHEARMQDQYYEWFGDRLGSYIDNNSAELNRLIRSTLSDEISFDDLTAQAEEELGPDADSTDITKRANDLLDEKIDELMEEQGREYEYAYDIAREEMEEDFRNSGLGFEEEWLSDIGVHSMSDAASEFGLNWPHMRDVNQGHGEVSIDDVANDFVSYTGFTNVKTSTSYHGVSDRSSSWIIEPDGSLEGKPGDGGLEFVSPALPMTEALQALETFKKWADSYGCYTGHKYETGLHINISIPNYSIDNLDYIKLALFMGDQYVLQQFGRIGNSYAESALSIIKRRAKQEPQSVIDMFNKMQEHLSTAASKLVHSGATKKYTSINTKDGYVEFRGPGGDYLNMSTEEIANTAIRMAMALQIACDENAYKQEYGKKLYKLLGPEGETEGNTVTLFTKYVNNEITKATLTNLLRQVQSSRAAKKLPPDTKKTYKVWLTSSPMLTMEITARNPEDAIRRAQIQKPDWDRYRDDAFTVKVVGAAPESGTPIAATAGAAQPVGRAMSQDEESWPTWNVENINTGSVTQIRAPNSEAALSLTARFAGQDSSNFRIATQPARRETYGGGFVDARVRNSITGESYTVRASTPEMARQIAVQNFGGTPYQWQVFGFPEGEF